ncbi:hypothetical protein [Azospirillum largimobile]
MLKEPMARLSRLNGLCGGPALWQKGHWAATFAPPSLTGCH